MATRPRAAVMMQGSILCIVCLLVGPLLAATQTTDPVEKSALLAFLAALDDPYGNLETWTSNTDPCGLPWKGVFCVPSAYPSPLANSNYSHVTELRLLTLNLSGQLVPELGNLPALSILDVMWNQMTGPVPKEIGNLSNMLLLLLNGNQFNGSLPDELGNLQKMIRIQVDQNSFSGPVPLTFNNLTAMNHLHMNNNSFTGGVPTGLGSLPQLLHVLLDNNNLTGPLPEDLGSSQSLLIIQLDNNQFVEGTTIPSSWSKIPTLRKLSLRNCSLNGTIPSFTDMTFLAVLDLSYNNFSGPIPNSSFPANLTSIDLSYNQLTGDVPVSFGTLEELQYLEVRNNDLNGTIPTNLGTGTSFSSDGSSPIILDFQDNSLLLDNNSNLATLQNKGYVKVWLAGNPPACPADAPLNPWCVPDTVGSYLEFGTSNATTPPPNSECSACNSPYVLVPSNTPSDCACAAPITVKYRLKSPGFLVFDLYEEQFLTYLSEGLSVAVSQVYIQSYEYQPGPRILMTILVFPMAPDVTFNDTELNSLSADFYHWTVPDSDIFGPYELIQFIPPGGSASGGGGGLSGGAIGGIIAGSVLLTAVLAAGLMFWFLKKHGWDPKAASRHVLARAGLKMIKVAGVRTFTFAEMVKATDNFSDKNILGQGGYGKVYFGTLQDGQKVAIKRAEEGSLQGSKEFETEIQLLSRVHHRNLVSLVGYCDDEGEHLQGEQMLVYEYMPNGTLREHIKGKKGTKMSMGIVTRLRIALGSARGIHYLHTQADPPIFHRDIKASNILLDEKYNAKVADFGLSKLAPTDVDFEGGNAGHVSTLVKGTPGYLDPEYFLTHKLTDKSDVYSFGVVLLELLTGLPPIHQGKNIIREVNAAYSAGHLTQIIDSQMGSYPIDTVEPLCKLALSCCHSDTGSRPSMAEVLHELEDIWKETPWSDVASHSFVSDLGDTGDLPSHGSRGFSRPGGFSSDMNFESISETHSTADLISHTNIGVQPR